MRHGWRWLTLVALGAAAWAAEPPVIRAVAHTAEGWLGAEESVSIVVVGTPKAVVTVELRDVANGIALTEIRPGVYLTDWRPPAGVGFQRPSVGVIGRLTIARQTVEMEAAVPLALDCAAPLVSDPVPAEGAYLGQPPVIGLNCTDSRGSGIDTAKSTLSLNGRAVAPLRWTDTGLVYEPRTALPVGVYTALASIVDLKGNKRELTWRFNVGRRVLITQFAHDGKPGIEPGDVLQVAMQAEAGGRAQFKIGDGPLQPMQEVQAGVYQGRYTVAKGEKFEATPVTGVFTARDGATETKVAEARLSSTKPAPRLTKPEFTSPKDGDKVDSPLVVTGKANAGEQVRVKVEYSTPVLILNLTGTLAEVTVTAGRDGVWRTEGINLETNATNRQSRFTISAWVVYQDGKTSETVKVTVGR